jgi:hypothetical protein
MDLRNLLQQLDDNAIYIPAFASHFSNEYAHTEEILNYLQLAIENKNADWVEYLTIAAHDDGLNKMYSKVLCYLLNEDWHYKHEDIVELLYDIKDPETVDCIYKATFRYDEVDEMKALQRKCIHALYTIHTTEAIDKIKLLANSDDQMVSDFAKQFLKD